MADVTYDDDEITEDQRRVYTEWAKARCEAWNWNADAAEIAKELIDCDIEPDSVQCSILCEVFNEFFKHPKMDVTEAIEQIMETFA